jgi:hypothetical protein
MSYEIILIEEFYVRKNGDLEITAIVENMGKQTVKQTFFDAPEYAPARCYTVIHKECLADDISFEGKTQEELEEIVNRHGLLTLQEWTVINDDDDRDIDDYVPSGSTLFF